MDTSISLFKSLNARHLSPKEVAYRFIPPADFSDLLIPDNSLIIGPRGSGKTTMLKMLQIPALVNWPEHLNEHLQNIDFISAFIPTDIVWKEQWAVIDKLTLSKEDKEQIKESIFLTHTVRAIVESIKHYCELEGEEKNELTLNVPLNKETEGRICDAVSNVMSIDCPIPSVEYLEHCVRIRSMKIGALVNKLLSPSNDYKDLPDYIHLPFLETISSVLSAINISLGVSSLRWALLFDELEIAPKSIRKKLIKYLRSVSDQKIIFKLSISPYSEDFDLFQDSSSPSGPNDFVEINLCYSQKENARPFCKDLFKQVCQIYGVPNATPENVFGPSILDIGNTLRGESAYMVGSPLYKRFSSLKNKDKTFRAYLERKKVNIELMNLMTENDRASKVRKVTNIVAIRDVFLRADGVKSTKRRPSLYVGATTMLDITEGNPRLFLGIISNLVELYAKKEKTIPIGTQASSLLASASRYRALLGTIRVDCSDRNIMNLSQLIDQIGHYFHDQLVVRPFTADPIGCFIVDENVPKPILEALGRALNAGAIIYFPINPGHQLLDDLVGKRFRISSLLAPHYKILLSSNKARTLNNILNDSDARNVDMFNGK